MNATVARLLLSLYSTESPMRWEKRCYVIGVGVSLAFRKCSRRKKHNGHTIKMAPSVNATSGWNR